VRTPSARSCSPTSASSSPSPRSTRPRAAPPRPDPGGQPRPDARRREVRLAQGLQVLDLRHVVDPPGHHPRHRQHRPHHPPPVHAGDTLARLQKARARLELKYGRPATLSELSAEVEMPEDKVTEALRFAAEPLSLSSPCARTATPSSATWSRTGRPSPLRGGRHRAAARGDLPAAGPPRRARAGDPQAALRPRPGEPRRSRRSASTST
jgi:hypothetical protein